MNENINSELYNAAGVGDEALVSQLVGQGAEVDWRDQYNYTALHRAALCGHTPVVTRLIDEGWSLEARDEYYGFKPLSEAAYNGHLETVKFLLLRGAQIDTQSDLKDTPLHLASRDGFTDLVQLLLQCGANQEIRNDRKKTAEDVAENDKTRAVFSKYKEKKELSELLQQAIVKKNYDVAMILILQGATLEGSDNLEKLAHLSRKAQMMDDDFVKALVSGGTDISGIVYRKLLVLINVALIRENIEKYLIQNIEVKEEESGNTPLHAAAASDNEKALKFLLSNGASSTQFQQNKKGQTPLEISKHDKYIFKIILIDFLNYALKSPKFSSDEFQNQLGSGVNLFCLKRDFEGNKTLLEFLNDQGLIKEVKGESSRSSEQE